MLRRFSHQSRVAERSEASRSPGKVITEIAMTMKRNGGVVNELTFNAQLTVKLSLFSRLQSLINQPSGGVRYRITTLPFDSPRRSQEASACSRVAAACFHSSLIELEHFSVAWPAPSATSTCRNSPQRLYFPLGEAEQPAVEDGITASRSVLGRPLYSVDDEELAWPLCGLNVQAELFHRDFCRVEGNRRGSWRGGIACRREGTRTV